MVNISLIFEKSFFDAQSKIRGLRLLLKPRLIYSLAF